MGRRKCNAFEYCYSLSDLSPLEKWNTRSLQRMGHMFAYNPSLISIEPLRNWNLHNAQYQDNVFAGCTNLVDIDAINNWDYSSTVTVPRYGNYPLDNMFYGDHKIQINISSNGGLADFIRRTGRIDAFHNSSNQITTSNTKLIELLTILTLKVKMKLLLQKGQFISMACQVTELFHQSCKPSIILN